MKKLLIILGVVYSLLFTGCVGTQVGTSQGKYQYDKLHSSDFPAYVESIIFGSGNVLSQNSSMKWGNWTISFPKSQAPIAKSGGGGDIVMTGFIASNPVEGEYSCTIQACKACAYTGYEADRRQFIRRCRIIIGEGQMNFDNVISIVCFTDVKLK